MKYIKLFDTHAEYAAYMGGGENPSKRKLL